MAKNIVEAAQAAEREILLSSNDIRKGKAQKAMKRIGLAMGAVAAFGVPSALASTYDELQNRVDAFGRAVNEGSQEAAVIAYTRLVEFLPGAHQFADQVRGGETKDPETLMQAAQRAVAIVTG